MDGYLQCLMEYIQENRIGKRLYATGEYRNLLKRSDETSQALMDRLDAGQRELLQAFNLAQADVEYADRTALFEEGVELGKWLAR